MKKCLKAASRLLEYDFLNSLEENDLNEIIREIRETVYCERGSLLYIDRDKGMIYPRITEGMNAVPLQLNLNLGIAGLVALKGEIL
ncbi:MAG: hypothetical protein R6V20_06220 [Desulfobia sp.]